MNGNNINRGQQQQQLQQYSFFAGAPFTKLIVLSTLVMYVTANAGARGGGGGESWNAILRMNAVRIRDRGEIYRYASSKVTPFLASNGEFFVNMTLLIFLLRKFEREMGSRKMILFCLFVMVGTITVEAVFIHSTLLNFNYQYAGPYALVGALFSLFHQYTPRLYPHFFSILGVAFSEKVFYYLWFLVVAGGAGWNSALAVTIGWIVALLYRVDMVFKNLDIPEPLAAILSDIGSRISEAPPHILVTAAARGGGGGGAAAATGGGPRRPAARHPAGGIQHPTAAAMAAAVAAAGGMPPLQRTPPAAAVADPAAIEQLVMMGFSRPQVVEALQWSNNDVQRAAERLLTQS
jgi:membrane associated rhomboid family serine protease